MSNVRIIVDSAAALPPALAAEHAITVVPLHLSIGQVSYTDGQVSLEDLVSHLDPQVKTSGPSPGEWNAAFEDAVAEEGQEALVLTVSAEMSSTYGSAQLAASASDHRIEVLDTGTAAGGEGLVALAAARASRAGGRLQEVIDAATRAIERVRLVATVSSLDQLVRSGRVPNVAGWAGRRLNVHPLFAFTHGQVHPLRPAFSLPSAIERTFRQAISSAPAGTATLHAAVLHALAPDQAEELLERVQAIEAPVDAYASPFSAVMVAHTGPGLVGLAWWWDESDGVERRVASSG